MHVVLGHPEGDKFSALSQEIIFMNSSKSTLFLLVLFQITGRMTAEIIM